MKRRFCKVCVNFGICLEAVDTRLAHASLIWSGAPKHRHPGLDPGSHQFSRLLLSLIVIRRT